MTDPHAAGAEEAEDMSAWLTMSLREVGRWPTLTVTGEINLGNIAEFDAAIADAAPRYPRLIVDLTAARLSGSAAIRCLYRHADCLAAVVVASGSTLSRALSLAPFLTIVAVEPGAHAPAVPGVDARSVPRPRAVCLPGRAAARTR